MFARITLALVLGVALLQSAAAQTGIRSLTGTVTDKRGNALPGAIVHIENTGDLTVRTYITDKQGHYWFNDLWDNADYTVFVQYKRWRSDTKTLSKLNSEHHPEINLRIPID